MTRYNHFILGRQAEIDIANLLNGKLNADVHHGEFDILFRNKIKIQVKSATLTQKDYFRFSFNEFASVMKEKSDFLICVGYNKERNEIIKILCIPISKIPKKKTSISFRVKYKYRVRPIWEKYTIPAQSLKKYLNGLLNQNILKGEK